MRRIKIIWLGCVVILLGVMVWLIIDRIPSTTNTVYEEKISENTNCTQISIISDNSAEKLILVEDKTVRLNLDLLSEKSFPGFANNSYNKSRKPLFYNFTQGRENLVIIGDSYSAGNGVSYNESYASYLSSIIDMNIINLGLDSYNTDLEVDRFKEMGLKYKPKIVILQYFENDIESTIEYWGLFWYTLQALKDNGFHCSQYEKTRIYEGISRIYYENKINSHRQQALERNVLGPMRELGKLSLSEGFEVIFIELPGNEEDLREIEKVVKEYNFTLIDIRKEMDFSGYVPPFSVSQENPHFSSATNKRLAQIIKSKIKKD